MKDRVRRNWEFRNYRDQDGDSGKRELYITGEIMEGSWFCDDDTHAIFEEELYSGSGDVDIWVSSPGGDVFTAAKIYNAITQYKGGKVTAYIYGFCASAATVVVMAASEIYMSPTALMLIHNPSMIAWGESEDMRRSADHLDSVKETIINAYVDRTGLSRDELSEYMNKEKAFDATEAIELGFADGFIKSEQDKVSAMSEIRNSVMARFYNSVSDWKLAFQAKANTTPRKQEEKSMVKDKEKLSETAAEATTAKAEEPKAKAEAAAPEKAAVDAVPTEPKVEDAPKAEKKNAAVVDIKDFESVVNELREYKEETGKEIAKLREYKAQQEAEIRAKDLVGLPGISDERRIELAKTADDELFSDLKDMAKAMREFMEPVGVTTTADDETFENKEEVELRKKIDDYAKEHNVSANEAFLAITNGGK